MPHPFFSIYTTDHYGQILDFLFHLTREPFSKWLGFSPGTHLQTAAGFFACLEVRASFLHKILSGHDNVELPYWWIYCTYILTSFMGFNWTFQAGVSSSLVLICEQLICDHSWTDWVGPRFLDLHTVLCTSLLVVQQLHPVLSLPRLWFDSRAGC